MSLSLDNGCGSPKYGFAVVGMTALDLGHNFARLGLCSYAGLTSPKLSFAGMGLVGMLVPALPRASWLPFPSLRPAVRIHSSLVEILSFPFSFRIFSGSYLYLDWLLTHGGFSCMEFLSLCFKTH